MIETIHGKHHLICDNCSEEHPDNYFDTFDDACEAGNKDGWKAKSISYGAEFFWINLCPKCKKYAK